MTLGANAPPPPPPNDKFFKISEDKIVKNIRVLYFKKGDVIIKGYICIIMIF